MSGELTAMTISFADEQNRSLDLGSRLAAMEREMSFKIERLGCELNSERGRTNIDVSSIDTKIKGEYADR